MEADSVSKKGNMHACKCDFCKVQIDTEPIIDEQTGKIFCTINCLWLYDQWIAGLELGTSPNFPPSSDPL